MPENSEQLVWAITRSSAFLTVGFVVVWATLKLVKIQSPRFHRVCWLVVLAQGLVFFTLQIDVPLYPAVAGPPGNQRAEVSRHTTRRFEEFSEQFAVNHFDSAPSATIINVHPESDHSLVFQAIVVCWLAGIVVTLTIQAVNYFRFVSGISPVLVRPRGFRNT